MLFEFWSVFCNVNFFPPLFSSFFLLRLLLVLDKITAFIGLLLIREVNQIRGAVSKEKTSLGDILAGAIFRGERKIELYIKISSHEACFFFSFFTVSAILSLLYWTSLVLPKTNKACKRLSQLALVPGERAICSFSLSVTRLLAAQSHPGCWDGMH